MSELRLTEFTCRVDRINIPDLSQPKAVDELGAPQASPEPGPPSKHLPETKLAFKSKISHFK